MHNDNEDKKIIIGLDKPLREAMKSQKSYLAKLKSIVAKLAQDNSLDESRAKHLYQLVLQHRLDKENVVTSLMHTHKNLCLSIGLEEQGSLKHNMDMLVTQLGTDNCLKELSLMGHMLEKLNKALALTEKNKLSYKQEKAHLEKILKKMQHLSYEKSSGNNADSYLDKHALAKDDTSKNYEGSIADDLRFAIGLQAYFSQSISYLSDAYHDMPNLPKFGIVYDYLVTLKGPYSDILLMLRQGIELTDEVLQVLANKLGLSPHKSVNQLLHLISLEVDHLYLEQQALQHEYAIHKNDVELMSTQLNAQIDAEASVHVNLKRTVAPAPEPNTAWKQKSLNLFNRS